MSHKLSRLLDIAGALFCCIGLMIMMHYGEWGFGLAFLMGIGGFICSLIVGADINRGYAAPLAPLMIGRVLACFSVALFLAAFTIEWLS